MSGTIFFIHVVKIRFTAATWQQGLNIGLYIDKWQFSQFSAVATENL